MKKYSNWLSLVLVLALAMSFTGCASEPQVEETSMAVATEVSEEAPAEVVEAPAEEPAKSVSLDEEVKNYFANMPGHIYKINQAEFIEIVKAGEDMTVLDIRSAADYAKGHVEGAVNAPWGGTAISDVLSKLPQDKPLYVYCYSGQTAGQAVHTLNIAGFDARSVNLGFNFGISKVDGYEAVITTEATAVTEDITEITPEIQEAIHNYYAGLGDVKETKFKNYKVSEDNLKAMMDANEDFYLLSIRSGKDFAQSHIEGASNLPWGAGMELGFDSLPKDKPVVVYCYSGQTAGQTVAGLRLLGIDAVSLNGGMGVGSNAPLGWTNKGHETVSGAVESEVMAYFANMPKHIYKINQKDFVEMVQAGENMTVLDIRSAADYAKGHVEGAVNAPWGGTAISDILVKLPQDKPLFVYCYSGQTAGQAVHTLNVAGFDARSVNLGFNFGISKVEGYEAVITDVANVPTENVSEIDPSIQTALHNYYEGLASVKETKFKNYKVSEKNLNEMMTAGEDFYLLSIRSEKDFGKAHIEGASNLPWGVGMEQGFAELPTDKPVVVYCYSGQTAGQTVAALRLLGVDAVSLNGGMGVGSNAPLGWVNNDFPVVQ